MGITVLVLASATNVRADRIDQYLRAINFIRTQSQNDVEFLFDQFIHDKITGKAFTDGIASEISKEDAAESGALRGFLRELKESDLGPFGGSMYADQFPISHVPIGQMALLTFAFLKPDSLQPTVGPSIAFVVYDVNLDPSNPGVFKTIGTSFDATSNFALPFTASGFEPLIRATPFDASGKPIQIPGVDGDNIAVGYVVDMDISVPEPNSDIMMLTGAGLLACARKRHIQRKQPD
jgi:hypothetical protein